MYLENSGFSPPEQTAAILEDFICAMPMLPGVDMAIFANKICIL